MSSISPSGDKCQSANGDRKEPSPPNSLRGPSQYGQPAQFGNESERFCGQTVQSLDACGRSKPKPDPTQILSGVARSLGNDADRMELEKSHFQST